MAEPGSEASRRAEEQAKLVERLRRSLVTVVDDNNDLKEYNATLKKSQAQLLERTSELNDLVARLQATTAESAAANARLTRELGTTKALLESTSTKATELATELNAYRETEGAIATALATASVEDLPEPGAAAAAASSGGAPGSDGTPAWLEAEARAGSDARSRSLKVQVLALRRALFKVARRAVQRGASEEQIGTDIDEAVGSAASPHGTHDAPVLPMMQPTGGEGTADSDAKASTDSTTSLDRYRRALGVASTTAAAQEDSSPSARPGASSATDEASSGNAQASEVIQPPAPINHTVGGESVPPPAEVEITPELLEPADGGSELTVGLLGFLLAPPIAIADALAAASEAVFGTDEDEEEAVGKGTAEIAPVTSGPSI